MPTFEEALALANSASTEYITVDPVKKVLVVPDYYKTVGVEGDKLGRRLSFKFPTRLDLVNVAADTVRVYWTNASGETSNGVVNNRLTADGYTTFTYDVPQAMTKTAGTVNIRVCISNDRNNDAVVDQMWHTAPYELTVLSFGEHDLTAPADDPAYQSALEQLQTKVSSLESELSAMTANFLDLR